MKTIPIDQKGCQFCEYQIMKQGGKVTSTMPFDPRACLYCNYQRMKQQSDEDNANRFECLPLSSISSKKMKEAAKACSLPWDVLESISNKLDLDDLFQFAGVCKNWNTFHKIYWRNFMASQEPVVVHSYVKIYPFLSSIADQDIHYSKMASNYAGSSNGYMIIADDDVGILRLMNPFTRRMKEINVSSIQDNLDFTACHALLAFAKGSVEFIIVVLCKSSFSLHVYQSRNSSWVTYSTKGDPWKVVDLVVLHNIIYAITDETKIGLLSLNSPSLKFLELKNAPSVTSKDLKLVNHDGQLLVVHFEPKKILDVYKIEFSTMEYVKLETLGEIALFHAKKRKCYALSNPRKWGFETNSVYYLDCMSRQCKVFSADENKMKQRIVPREPQAPTRYWLDWILRCQHDEVDYSLVE